MAMLMTMVSLPGPPKVSRKMLPMLWKVPMKAPTKLMITSGKIVGIVTWRILEIRPAPSSAAAS